MKDTPALSFILPCLDEADPLESVVTSLRLEAEKSNLTFEIIIVDNGSTDGSIAIAEKMVSQFPCVHIEHCSTLGYGAACRHGARTAAGNYIIFLDADGTYTAQDALTCARLCIKHVEAIVVGDRLRSATNETMPWSHRHIGTPLFSYLIYVLHGKRVRDMNCGLRAFPKHIFNQLNCTANGMEFATEAISRAAKADVRFVSFPISYQKRKGVSKLRTVRDGFRHLYTIFATAFTKANH